MKFLADAAEKIVANAGICVDSNQKVGILTKRPLFTP